MKMTEIAVSTSPEQVCQSKTQCSSAEKHSNSSDHGIVVRAGKSWSAFSIAELWAHRELLYFLTLRDLKIRYKQTLLGAVWVVIQPLLMTLVFTVFLGFVARMPASAVPYPLYVYSGLLPWMFISGGIIGCSTSLTGNASLLTKVYFPRLLLPAANLGTRIVDLAISFIILMAIMLFYRFVLHNQVPFTWKLLFLPLLMIPVIAFTFGVGILVASVNVKYRDVGVALPVLIQLWMFTSPIVYPSKYVPVRWLTFYSLNPVVGMIDGFRGAMFGTHVSTFSLVACGIVTVLMLSTGVLVFRHAEESLTDLV
jgi:lipopolysaccharide transport system permease protein